MNNGRDFNNFSNASDPNWNNIPHFSRTDSSVGEVMDCVRELLSSYNDNIRTHNQFIDNYNTNIFNIINMLQTILDYHLSQQRIPPYRNRNNTQGPTDTRFSFNSTIRRRNHNDNRHYPNLDIASLIYLLNLPSPTANENTSRNNGLTHVQIDQFTQIINFDVNTMNEHQCPITLEEFTLNEEVCQIRACGHYFKRFPLLHWFDNHNVCPLCRCNLTTTHTNSTNNTIDLSLNDPQFISIEPTVNVSPETTPGRVNFPTTNQLTPLFENLFNSLSNTQSPRTTTTSNPEYQNFARIFSEILLEQTPTMDISQNLLFTLEIPMSDTV